MFRLLNDNFSEIKYNCIRQYKKNVRKLSTNAFRIAVKNMNESVLDDMMSSVSNNMSFEVPINSAIKNLSIIDNPAELLNFYQHIGTSFNLDARPLTISLKNTNIISKIRPQYLVAYRRDLNDRYMKFAMGCEDTNTDIKKDLDKLLKKYKASIIKVESEVDLNVLQKVQHIKPEILNVTSQFVNNEICQFIRNYNNTRTQLINENIEMRDAIIQLEQSIRNMAESLIPTKLTRMQEQSLQYFIYYSVKTTYELLAYITMMTVERTSCYVYNINAYYKLYNDINNFYQDTQYIVDENCIDANLDNINDDDLFDSIKYNDITFIVPAIQQVIDQIQFEVEHITKYAKNDE